MEVNVSPGEEKSQVFIFADTTKISEDKGKTVSLPAGDLTTKAPADTKGKKKPTGVRNRKNATKATTTQPIRRSTRSQVKSKKICENEEVDSKKQQADKLKAAKASLRNERAQFVC